MKHERMTPAKAKRLGWTRVDERPWRKTTARWEHASGWWLYHCGHPTANWPYALIDPRGRMHRMGAISEALDFDPNRGFAWRTLELAFAYVDSQLRAPFGTFVCSTCKKTLSIDIGTTVTGTSVQCCDCVGAVVVA